MPFFLNTDDEQQAMLEAIGVDSIDDLFAMVPADCGWAGRWTCRRRWANWN